MTDRNRLGGRFGAPGNLVFVPLVGLLAISGCASDRSATYTDDDYDGSVSAREYGYVRPSEDVWGLPGSSRGSDRHTVHATGGDLWARVRTGMKLDRYANPRIDVKVQRFRQDPLYLAKLSQRSGPYLQVVVDEIQRRGLPTELALLPHVESRYNPAATSPKAAAGMWQFIPETGRIMGLRQDSSYDGRRDILASTKAALDYLELLHRRLGGGWELAMAAYNCGPARVEAAMESNRRQGRSTDFWSLNLPAETEAYVPQILAAARLVAEPAKYGLSLPPVSAGPRLELVKTDRPVDLVRAAVASGVQVSELQRLNPGIKNGVSAYGAPNHLLVPAGAGKRVGAELGRAQVMPATAAAVTLNPTPAVAFGTLARPIPAVDPPTRPAEPARPMPATGPIHVVKSGETLASIAMAQGIDVRDLADLNAMSPRDPLLPGQSLRISTVGGGPTPSRLLVTHRVRRGDSLDTIARRYGVTVSDIKRWNPVAANALHNGEMIRIYPRGTDS